MAWEKVVVTNKILGVMYRPYRNFNRKYQYNLMMYFIKTNKQKPLETTTNQVAMNTATTQTVVSKYQKYHFPKIEDLEFLKKNGQFQIWDRKCTR